MNKRSHERKNFRSTAPKEVLLVIHESPGSRFSFIPGDTLGKGSTTEILKIGEWKSFAIMKEKKVKKVQRDLGNCKDYEPDDSQAKCHIESNIMPLLKNKSRLLNYCNLEMKLNVTRLCVIPQGKNVFEMARANPEFPTEMSQCQTKDEYVCMMNWLGNEEIHLKRNMQCPKPCTEITHNIITSKSIPAPFIEDYNESITVAYLYYESNNMILLEEYLVFDFSAILVAIGGSMGLFLGFSFLQCGTALFTYSIDVMKKLAHGGNEGIQPQ